MTFDPEPFSILPAFLHWLTVVGISLGAALLIALVLSLIFRGTRGPAAVAEQIADGVNDLFQLSGRRVFALATLTWKEALRRKALLVFVVFAVLFMFAGWFIPDTDLRADLAVKNHVSFVLRAVAWLVLPVVLLLACWGLPEDIKARSLHTVVTKPARRHEVVLGRMLGFAAVGTMLVTIMGAVGYVWIMRQVPADAQEMLVSRVPVYGSLSFLDREGNPEERGVNVGDVWDFRSYIEGGTRAAAIWKFSGITPERTGDQLRFESRFEAFRTHKGVMGKGLRSEFTFVNEDKDLRVRFKAPEVAEYRDGENVETVGRKISYYDQQSGTTRTVDLYDDLAPNGNLTIEVRCLDSGQYIGMARPDLFLRMPDKGFASGYFKSVLSVWMMMVLVVVLSVTASTFVKGPVASLLVLVLLVVGAGFHGFLDQIVKGDLGEGFGTVESVYRIVEHMNPMLPLEETPAVKVMRAFDYGTWGTLWLAYHVIPDFTKFSMGAYPANGFDVPWDAALLPVIAITLAYLIPCLLLAYYSLKLRELEAK